MEENVVRASTLAGQGQFSRAIQALTTEGIAEVCRATEMELRHLHPAAFNPIGPLPTTATPPHCPSHRLLCKKLLTSSGRAIRIEAGTPQEHLGSSLQQKKPCSEEPNYPGERHDGRKCAIFCGSLPLWCSSTCWEQENRGNQTHCCRQHPASMKVPSPCEPFGEPSAVPSCEKKVQLNLHLKIKVHMNLQMNFFIT